MGVKWLLPQFSLTFSFGLKPNFMRWRQIFWHLRSVSHVMWINRRSRATWWTFWGYRKWVMYLILMSALCLLKIFLRNKHSSGSSGRVRGEPRNMKSMRPPSAAIFFMTYFYRAEGGHGPLGPPGSATETDMYLDIATFSLWTSYPEINVTCFLCALWNFKQ